MNQILKIGLLELIQARRRLWLPGLALSVAVSSLLLFLSIQSQIENQFEKEGRSQLGADISIEAYKELPETTLENLKSIYPKDTRISKLISFNTMLQDPRLNTSTFVKLTAIDSEFPFYNSFSISGIASFSELETRSPGVIITQDLSQRLKLNEGSLTRIGDSDFKIFGISSQPGSSINNFMSFAPPVWIHQKHLKSTQLLNRPGRIAYEYRWKLSPNLDVSKVREQFRDIIADSDFKITTFNEAGRGFQRIFDQVTLFAQLIIIASMLLSGLALLGAFRNWLHSRRYLIAILRTLGADQGQIKKLIYGSMIAMIFVFCLLGMIVGTLCVSGLSPLLSNLIGINLSPIIPISSYGISIAFGTLLPILFCSFSVLDLDRFKPIILLRSISENIRFTKKHILLGLLILTSFSILTYLILSDFKKVVSLATGLIIVISLSLITSLTLLKALPSMIGFFKNIPLAISLPLQMLRKERDLSLLNCSLFFGLAFILSSILKIENDLQSELSVESSIKQSSLFVFDVGEEEKNKIDSLIDPFKASQIHWAPWVRVRVKSINNKSIESYPVGVDGRVQSEFLVTDLDRLESHERIVEGNYWKTHYNEQTLPEVSLTREFAKRFDITIDDIMTFEMYGIPFQARVSNFRIVRWTEFQPGFRIAFQPGTFRNAPLSYLASVSTSNADERLAIKEKLNKNLPSVSVVDISPIKRDLQRIMSQISLVLKFILSLLAALSLIMIAVLSQEKVINRERDYAVLRCIGATGNQTQIYLLSEIICITLIPSLVGTVVGILSGHIVLSYYFNLSANQHPMEQAFIPLLLTTLVGLIAWMSSTQASKVSPLKAFQS